MPIVTISNNIQFPINEISVELKKAIENDLTINNPEYTQALKFGYSLHGKNRYLHLYQIDRENLILPRGYGPSLIQHFQNHQIKVQWDDQRLTLPSIEFESKIKLRDYQAPAVEALVRKRQGGVVAGCGAGKTQIMLEAMARIGQRALWVCHSYELLNQTMERALEVFNGLTMDDIGIIAGGKVSIGKKLTFALVQTLSKLDLSSIKNKFGAVFIDEAHHLAAKTFYHPIGEFPARYRLWASATPVREDGLTEMVFVSGGPILHMVNSCELPTITPDLSIVETGFRFHSEDYPKLISNLVKDDSRNDLIVKTIIQDARIEGNYCLVLSDRKEHLSKLKELIEQYAQDLKVEILVGTMTKKARADVMERMKSKSINILMATQLAREGLDITYLNRLFLVTPKRAAGAITQEVGRIMRPSPGKIDAMVIDFWDNKSPILKSQFWKRRDAYTKLGMAFSPNKIRRFIEK